MWVFNASFQVAAWLDSKDELRSFTDAFLKLEITGSTLLDLTHDDLMKMDIDKCGPRKAVLRYILREERKRGIPYFDGYF